MKEAMFTNAEKCLLCPQECTILEGKKGFCRVRKNVDGRVYSLVYSKPVTVHVDPIEKKPLYHFLPGSKSLSLGTVGCNLACEHCQNFDISCAEPESIKLPEVSPEEIVDMAIVQGCQSISYTYNEPTVFIEYAIDIAVLAKKKGLKNILVTNGFINRVPAEKFAEVMDAANIDLKSFDDNFYKNICKGRLQPVLDTIRLYHKKMWVEVTNLIIDGKNDNMADIEKMCRWLPGVPLHFSRAFPMHKMTDIMPTSLATLQKAEKIARKYLDFVYVGNTGELNNTKCPECNRILIDRSSGEVTAKCECGYTLPGVIVK